MKEREAEMKRERERTGAVKEKRLRGTRGIFSRIFALAGSRAKQSRQRNEGKPHNTHTHMHTHTHSHAYTHTNSGFGPSETYVRQEADFD